MLNFYIEIQLQSTDDVPIWFIMSKAYGMIHKSLGRASANGKCPVGVSFPHMDEKAHEIGDIIRLFAEDSETLNALQLQDALSRYTDYLIVSKVRPVRPAKGYVTYYKVHYSFTNSQIRRFARHRGISEDEAFRLYKVPERRHYPGIRLRSSSTNQDYMLFINSEQCKEPREGLFSTMGLSSKIEKITVPVFS
ncbi:MAG: type I-F CRISPR-associated endoribonuclease Cas6/Csy4 [Succinivibrionaceae bacterium]|jgi:CRISPR-associated endonuclease Csy4|nr:type I-F CRISPR-associated endoribonuclease Cas6/Csy4 [Succinivibrionaceae bacterium]